MSANHVTFSHKVEPNNMPDQQQHHTQLPLRKEIDDEGRICGVVLPEAPAPVPALPPPLPPPPPPEENNLELGKEPQSIVKTEAEIEEEFAGFIESAHNIFLKISSKEMTIKTASEKLGRPYSYVYSRYQEFCG